MSETYLIEAVGEPREWTNDHGSFLAYPLTLEGVAGPKEWSRKPSSRTPAVGERIVGDINGDKIKVDLNATKELGGGSSGGGGSRPASKSREWKPESAYDPEKVARIGRAHAQEMALRMLAIDAVQTGREDFRFNTADVFKLADEFQADVDQAAAKAAQGGGVTDAGNGSEGAPDTPGRHPVPAQDPDYHQRLSTLLEAAGVNNAAARAITNYALENMTVEEQDAAVERLQNPNMVTAAVNRLRERTEGHLGEPLPSAPAEDDDIPF